MKILYLSLLGMKSFEDRNIYCDLIKQLIEKGHEVYSIVGDGSFDNSKKTSYTTTSLGSEILHISVGRVVKAKNLFKKGLDILTLERKFKKTIKFNCKDKCFDLVLYTAPPITLAGAVNYAKKRFKAKSYLMLKDIFPQNAVDLGMMSKTGIMGIVYKMFRRKEKKLYNISDTIGCMSKMNVEYILSHNKYVDESRVEIFPNALYNSSEIVTVDKDAIFEKYNIPQDKIIFIYGGNLGKPQGLDFLVDGIKACESIDNICFIVVGDGSERERVFAALDGVKNVICMQEMPASDYNNMCASCDVGMIMLDKRSTIPNYPSRTLSYMHNAMPMMACTDVNTDIRNLIEDDAKCGKWCHSDNAEDFVDTIRWFVSNKDNFDEMGQNAKKYLIENFDTKICVNKIEEFKDR